MAREYEDYLRDLLDAVEKVKYFIKDLDFKNFKKDDKTKFAVIRALEIIGEATKHIHKKFASNIQKCPGEKWLE
jgi:uncharacterized protein with HEPN domain